MARPSAALKYFELLPLVRMNARIMNRLAMIPESALTAIGVPYRFENRPRIRGPAPS